jgi:hypothetical protein
VAAHRHRFIALAVLALSAVALAKGKGKILEFKGVPKTIPTIAEALPKEKKDATKRAALALSMDQLLREKPEVTDGKLYDDLTGTLINDVLEKMCEPSEVFSTEHGPDHWNPRADVFFKDSVKIFPGRVSKEFRRKYTKKPMGKNIDRGYRGQPATVEFTSAASEDEFQAWTDTKGWGMVIHEAHVDTASGVARIGLTWVSPGTKETPGGHFERPAWVAFYKQPKPGVGMFQLLAVESETATDWREQPVNLVPPKTEPNDLERKLRLAVWMEDVRALPVRPAFSGDEEKIFNLDGEGDEKLEAAQLPMLEAYRDSSSPMVRAATELKIFSLGGTAKVDNIEAVLKTMKHGAVKPKLEQLKAAPTPQPQAAADPIKDAGK